MKKHNIMDRFIPAGAGNTHANDFAAAADFGLSPLARGTRRVQQQIFKCSRFIPAGAGNTSVNIHCSVQVAVYPRWRGEHVTHFVLMDGDTGLSPLARGTHEDQFYIMAKVRFIPAGAGNTITGMRVSRQNAVYPRWRGEHPESDVRIYPVPGLSPLARGTHNGIAARLYRGRFIPAGAGNTCRAPLVRYR